jgi:hypothetical protein
VSLETSSILSRVNCKGDGDGGGGGGGGGGTLDSKIREMVKERNEIKVN